MIKESNLTISKLENKIKKKNEYQNDLNIFRSRMEVALKENSDIEELLNIQEEEIKNLSLNNTKYSNDISGKSINIENINKDMITFNKILIESKQNIQKLKQKIKKKDEEEIKRQNLISEKINEITMLKELIESLKYQKDQSNMNINNNNINNNDFTSLLNQSPSKLNIEEEVLNNVKPGLNDIEEDNLKEIAGLMKKVLEE